MGVVRKRRLAAMAVALEESAEDEEDSGRLQCERAVQNGLPKKKSIGMQNQLYEELLTSDPEQYKRLLRLGIEQFHHLLALIEPNIVRQDTMMRSSVPAKTRLHVTLRFLASDYPGHAVWLRIRLAFLLIVSDFCTHSWTLNHMGWQHSPRLHVLCTTS
ncbi:hypothetical protein MRX96_050452 [Rhipicephalus microplus]